MTGMNDDIHDLHVVTQTITPDMWCAVLDRLAELEKQLVMSHTVGRDYQEALDFEGGAA